MTPNEILLDFKYIRALKRSKTKEAKDELTTLMQKYDLPIKNALNPYHRSIVLHYLNTGDSWVKVALDSGTSKRQIWRIIDASANSMAYYMNKQEEKRKVVFISSERKNDNGATV